MSTIRQQIEALEFERQGYVTFGKDDRIAAVDEQLEYWRGQLKERGADAPTEPLSPTEKKRAEADGGVISEVEAAKTPPADGEKASNDLAAQHAAQPATSPDTAVITETEAIANPPQTGEEQANAEAAEHATEAQPASAEPNVITEAQAVGGLDRPARNASTEDWRAYANSLPAPLDVREDAGREEIVAAYIQQFAPSGNASKETWMKYASEHGIDTADKTRDEIRAAAVDAGWAKADDAPQNAQPKPKRDTADNTPRSTR